MKSIRRSVFETNSSSTHSLSICSKNDFELWKDGKVVFVRDGEKFIPLNEAISQIKKDNKKLSLETEEEIEEALRYSEFQTYERWSDSEYLENFEYGHTTEHGDEIVAFGKYGYDG